MSLPNPLYVNLEVRIGNVFVAMLLKYLVLLRHTQVRLQCMYIAIQHLFCQKLHTIHFMLYFPDNYDNDTT